MELPPKGPSFQATGLVCPKCKSSKSTRWAGRKANYMICYEQGGGCGHVVSMASVLAGTSGILCPEDKAVVPTQQKSKPDTAAAERTPEQRIRDRRDAMLREVFG